MLFLYNPLHNMVLGKCARDQIGLALGNLLRRQMQQHDMLVNDRSKITLKKQHEVGMLADVSLR